MENRFIKIATTSTELCIADCDFTSSKIIGKLTAATMRYAGASRRLKKIYRLVKMTFCVIYTGEEIMKWHRYFYRRFFAQQIKRSCLPDGTKVGLVPRSSLGVRRMPGDAVAGLRLHELGSPQV